MLKKIQTEKDIKEALYNPTLYFIRPEQVLEESKLSQQQKIELLKNWAYDTQLKEVAEEENMTLKAHDTPDVLDEIKKVLILLGVTESGGQTGKFGGQ